MCALGANQLYAKLGTSLRPFHTFESVLIINQHKIPDLEWRINNPRERFSTYMQDVLDVLARAWDMQQINSPKMLESSSQ